MNEEKTQIADGVASELNAELGFKKIIFSLLLVVVTNQVYAGSGSKPRECVYIGTNIEVKEDKRGDGRIDDCLAKNAYIEQQKLLSCKADYFCNKELEEAEKFWFLFSSLISFIAFYFFIKCFRAS
jgi:hypothetical protein